MKIDSMSGAIVSCRFSDRHRRIREVRPNPGRGRQPAGGRVDGLPAGWIGERVCVIRLTVNGERIRLPGEEDLDERYASGVI